MIDGIMERFLETAAKRGYHVLPISPEQQTAYNDTLRHNNIDPDVYPIRACGVECSPRLKVYSTGGASLPGALVELELIAKEAVGEEVEITHTVRPQPIPLGEKIARVAANFEVYSGITSGDPNDCANIIISFARPPKE